VDNLFQHHEQQLLQEIGIKATGLRSTLAENHDEIKTTAEEEADGMANMTAGNHVQV